MTDEKEFSRLDTWVTEGDWVLDIGANIGHYTLRLSQLVGPSGRVIAFEPVLETFEHLTSNSNRLPWQNVTVLNVAVSSRPNVLGIIVPNFNTGLRNYYMAQLSDEASAPRVLAVAIDCLELPSRIKLAKIDVEGHELAVLKGMERLLQRDHPILIVEGHSIDVETFLGRLGYVAEDSADSVNRVFLFSKPANLDREAH